MQAMAQAFFSICKPFNEDGAVIKVLKLTCFNRQGSFAVMVEEKEPGCKLLKVDLVAYQAQIRVCQEGIPFRPFGPALSAYFE
jgi:hypothetical protein